MEKYNTQPDETQQLNSVENLKLVSSTNLLKSNRARDQKVRDMKNKERVRNVGVLVAALAVGFSALYFAIPPEDNTLYRENAPVKPVRKRNWQDRYRD